MQNRWEAETQQREAAAAKAQVPKTASAGRARDRWASSNDTQAPSPDATTAPSSRFTRPSAPADLISPPQSPFNNNNQTVLVPLTRNHFHDHHLFVKEVPMRVVELKH
jgi:hypothetical protein